jgi:glyoxylase-like metal-dependent hydrolase (beta-lactamase superfamily II)
MLIALTMAAIVSTPGVLHADNATGAVQLSSAKNSPFHHEAENVIDRVHLIYRPDTERVPAEGNVEVIQQQEGLVVIDAGGSIVAGKNIVAEIKRLSPLPVRYLIYTHWHGDHNLGSPAFKAAYPGMRVISTPMTRRHLMDNSEHADQLAQFNRSNAVYFASALKQPDIDQELRDRLNQIIRDTPAIVETDTNPSAILPDITFDHTLSIPDPVAPVEVLYLGNANTDGDAVIWLPDQRVLITGDILTAPVPYGSESYAKEWIDVLNLLDNYDFAYLIPGHGAVQTDHDYLRRVKALLVDIRTQVAPLAAQGLSLEEVQKRVDFTKDVTSFAGSSTWRQTEFSGYFLTSMIKNVYLEAKGEPIVQGQPLL